MSVNETIIKEETRQFDAEVGKILKLVIHSLYTNKDIFLRELISNASDACDKLRYLSVTDPSLIKNDNEELKIIISFNKEQRTLTIRDNGIGMNKQDLIENLGTIARSGTQNFMEQLTGDSRKDTQLIGQFGVGFYSAFMVADKVDVISRKAGEKESWAWSSAGEGEFTIGSYNEDFARGTSITMHLREKEEEYLDKFRIKHIVNLYSDHISFPVELIDEEGKSSKVNEASALWRRNRSDITDEQYKEFYKHISYAVDDPWLILHNKNEGTIEYTNLLFIPSQKPFDLFHPERKARVRLYVKKVFITDENVNIVPAYMRFLRGIVDSEDLPLNISRETLQHNHILDKIRKSLTKRVLTELKKKMTNDIESYLNFWHNFGAVLKEGLCEAFEDKDKMLEVCLFKSALHDKLISLDDYISAMKEGQKEIFYFIGEDSEKLKNSPQIEGFIKRGIDVLLFTDNVDDFWVNVTREYKGKEIMSVTRSDLDLDTINNQQEDKTTNKEEFKDKDFTKLIELVKNILGNKIKDVKISTRLTESPVCLAVSEGSMDIRMERFLIEQKQLKEGSPKILEINPKNAIIQYLNNKLDDATYRDDLTEIINVLYDQACIIEGEPVKDVTDFAKRINNVLQKIIN